MKFKIKESVKLNYEQLQELSHIFAEPDQSWNDYEDKIYLVRIDGECGIYHYRVNNIKKIITLLEVI